MVWLLPTRPLLGHLASILCCCSRTAWCGTADQASVAEESVTVNLKNVSSKHLRPCIHQHVLNACFAIKVSGTPQSFDSSGQPLSLYKQTDRDNNAAIMHLTTARMIQSVP